MSYRFIITQEDYYKRATSLFDVHSLLPNISYKSYKIVIMFWVVAILVIRVASENRIPDFFALGLAVLGIYILLETLIRCFNYMNTEIEKGLLGFGKACLVFLAIIIIVSFY